MAVGDWVQGFLCKVVVNSTLYAVARVSVDSSTIPLDTSNTDGVNTDVAVPSSAFETVLPGMATARISVTNPSFDSGANPFLAPYTILDGAYVTLQIYKAGVGSVSWLFPSVLITSVSDQIDAKGLQPLSFTAQSNGPYTAPTS